MTDFCDGRRDSMQRWTPFLVAAAIVGTFSACESSDPVAGKYEGPPGRTLTLYRDGKFGEGPTGAHSVKCRFEGSVIELHMGLGPVSSVKVGRYDQQSGVIEFPAAFPMFGQPPERFLKRK
jgi:hypothetical protein